MEKANGRRLIIGGTILGLLLGGSFFWNQQTSSKEKQLTIAGKLGAEPDIIINMYKKYELLCNIFFKNTTICIDPFHVMKKVNDSLNTFRKRIMRTYQNEKK